MRNRELENYPEPGKSDPFGMAVVVYEVFMQGDLYVHWDDDCGVCTCGHEWWWE